MRNGHSFDTDGEMGTVNAVVPFSRMFCELQNVASYHEEPFMVAQQQLCEWVRPIR